MDNKLVYPIHPEAYPHVVRKYRELVHKNPGIDDGALIWNMAKRYVHTKAMADTAILRSNYGL